ncbi:ephrin-B2a-like protein [Lates japonicus]|uniref:Ephrin-B2a-like protein n=1 Tax=Lates japonicus TaxID=270547 RepID=A0AAD3NMA6_LATJO|nr:ephrin-B2a-like protein [Lates japonicus]
MALKKALFVPGQGVVLYPQIGDKLDIVCPRVDGGVGDGVEYYKVYMVPREQLESCTITKADTPLLNCVKPDQDVKFTLKFQEFSPNLWGLEFFRGKDYYIISTLNGTLEGIDNHRGGSQNQVHEDCHESGTKSLDPCFHPKTTPPGVPYPPASGDGPHNNDGWRKQKHRGESSDNNKATVWKSSSIIIGFDAAISAGITPGSAILINIIMLVIPRRYRTSPQHAATPA